MIVANAEGGVTDHLETDLNKAREDVIRLARHLGLRVVSESSVVARGSVTPITSDAGIASRSRSARAWVVARDARDEAFGDGLFSDPAWDMLLELYIAHERGVQISVGSLCRASNVPASTAIRWIGVLEERGLVVRSPDKRDRRRFWVSLSDRGLANMVEALDGWGEGDRRLPGAQSQRG